MKLRLDINEILKFLEKYFVPCLHTTYININKLTTLELLFINVY